MLQIELMSWKHAEPQASAIRLAVFVDEQGVPREIEMDEFDPKSLHALAVQDGEAVGTARLLPDGHIGRMAVLKPWRGRGIGSRLLVAMVQAARARGESRVALSAQVHALGFYRAQGFQAEGPVYEEAGIPHQAMTLAF
jgi:predicted GNAT family N-acyltransferase